VWMRYLTEGFFQPTIASSFGLGRGWGGIWIFLLAAAAAVALAAWATPRLRLPGSALGAGLACLIGWALFAGLAPTLLGIDHQGLLSILGAGDKTALSHTMHSYTTYPLKTLVPVAAVTGLIALMVMALLRSQHGGGAAPDNEPQAEPRSAPALTT